MKLKLYSPLKYPVVTQGFGAENTVPSMLPLYQKMGLLGHNGIDFIAPDGTPVFASHDGHVTFAGYDNEGGLGVVIRTDTEVDMDSGTSFAKTIYWHLKKDSLLVTGGQQVKKGQQIASADNTGLSTGSHLHFGLKPIAQGENDWVWYNTQQTNGYLGAIDPAPYLILTYQFEQNLRLGMNNNDVLELQKRLVKEGFAKYTPTGFFGIKTLGSVIAYQKAHSIPSTGFVGPITRNSLNG